MGRPKIYKDEEERIHHKKEAGKRATAKYLENRQRVHSTFTKDEYTLIKRLSDEKGIAPTTYVHDATMRTARQEEAKKRQ